MGEEVDLDTDGPELDDRTIAERVCAGDRDAFRLLVHRYQDRVYSVTLKQTGDPAVAEELAQDVFVRAFRYLRSFRGEAAFSTWITRIALNVSKDWFGSRAHREGRSNESFSVDRHDAPDPGEEAREVEERIIRMRRVLPRLKDPYREVLVLCGFEGRSYEEAATVLEIPVGTVRSRLHTARMMLRDLMMEDLA
jgi:RNA polymerase sigma-70 factor, ECF subfamily